MRVLPGLKFSGIVFGAVMALFATVAVGLYFYIGSGCRNEVIAEAASPDHHFKAVVFQRDCGATTGFSTQVSVVKASAGFGNSAGNVFTSDTNRGSAPSGQGGGPEVKIRWRSPGLLVVSYHSAARVFKAEQEVGSVKVKYEQLSQPGS